MLHANFTCSIFYRTGVIAYRSFTLRKWGYLPFFLLWPRPWSDAFHTRTWRVFPGDVPDDRERSLNVKDFEVIILGLHSLPVIHRAYIYARLKTSPLRFASGKQVAQLSQRERAAGWVSYGKSGTLELGDSIYGYYKSVFNHSDVFGQQSNRIRWKRQKGLLRRSRLLKVIEVGINRKPVCDFLLVINSIWQPIAYRCGVIAAYCSDFGHFAFLSHPLECIGTMYDVYLGLSGKRVVDFLLVITELFSLDVTAEALRAKIDRTSAISLQRGRFTQNFM